MKNVMCLLLLLLCYSSVDAQLLPPNGFPLSQQINNSGCCGFDGFYDVLDENCIYTETFFVKMTNIDLILGGADCIVNEVVPFPSKNIIDYPPMKLRMQINDLVSVVDINYLTTLTCANESNPYSVFGFKTTLSYDFSDECEGGDLDARVFPDISSELVMEVSAGVYTSYPICSHTGPNDLFSCLYFTEDQVPCPNSEEGCNDYSLANYSYTNEVECGKECLLGEIWGGGSSFGTLDDKYKLDQKQEELDWTQNDLSIQVSPNPFSDKILIELKNESSQASLKLYNASGQLVKEISKINSKQNDNLEWDTSLFPQGVYYLHVQYEASSEYIKLIKS